MKICIKNATLISMNKEKPQIEHGIDILIKNTKIEKIAKNIQIDEYTKIIDANEKVIMPGLINTHAHVPMSIFREMLDGYTLQDWLEKRIWPMEEKLTEEDIYYTSYLSFIEMIKTGTTTINDMYFMTDKIIEAAVSSGIRIQTTRTLMGNNQKENLNKIRKLEELINKYHEETVTFNMGIHGLYTTDANYLDECIKFNNKYNLSVHIHFCENKKEVEDIEKIYGKRPIEVIKEKFSKQKLILAHCVKLTKEEIKELSKLNVNVAHCPVSNLKLGCGIANIKDMIDNNINVSLGTDSQGSGSNLDLFETMKLTALLQKGSNENSKLLKAYDVLKMATINGAKTLGLEKEIGSIEVGKLADIIIIDIDDIKTKPINDLLAQIVYNVKSNNVETTIVNGKILMENHKLINNIEQQITSKCNEIIKRISIQ